MQAAANSRAIVLCQGDQGRIWQALKTPKQLLPFAGTTILERTIEQVQALGVGSIGVIAPTEPPWTDPKQNVTIITEERKVDQDFLDVLVNLRHLWNQNGPTIFIYGDTVFSWRMMADLLCERENPIHFATRFSPAFGTGTWRAEIFGFRILPSFYGELDEFLRNRQCSPYHPARDMWDMFHYLMDKREGKPGEPSYTDAGDKDYTIDIDYPGDLENLPMLEILAKDDRP